MKQVLLHIGVGKTGTSSIQNFLHHNRSRLRARCDLDYCEHGLAHEDHFGELIHAHYPVAWWLKSGDEAQLARLRRAIDASRCGRVLLSCENFYHHLEEEHIARFASLLEGLDVKVVCYVRRQDAYVESAWKQQVKVGEMRIAFGKFLQKHRSPEAVPKSHANYHARLQPWARAFGVEGVGLRVYDPGHFVGEDLIDDALDAFGIGEAGSAAGLERLPRTNIAIPGELAEVIRRTNRSGLVKRETQQAYVAFLRSLGEFDDPPLMSDADRRAVLRNYRMVNRQLFEQFWGAPVPASFRPGAIRQGEGDAIGQRTRGRDPAIRCLVAAWQRVERS